MTTAPQHVDGVLRRLRHHVLRTVLTGLTVAIIPAFACADPCGMVPPIYTGEGNPITRIGDQQTYVFYKDGVETFVIRPGFSGKIDEFGMLIPFPTPPSIRKVPDHIFPHIAAAIDPPEIVVDLRMLYLARSASAPADAFDALSVVEEDEVRVLRQEAVGMYEVAVLEAGSAAALRRWMSDHGYRYPDGMDKVCDEYVADKWCFVAVKTRVGPKSAADPRPGQRQVDVQLPSGSSFDGFVQAMGFRFHTDKLVVPMRLSAFNAGDLKNTVYILADGPRRIRHIPEEYVVRQIPGKQLIKNLTELLPIRVLGAAEGQVTAEFLKPYEAQRNPIPTNGAAKELFASDLLAVAHGQLALPHEEHEKELLRIGEQLGLRGDAIDRLNAEELSNEREATVRDALQMLEQMTMSVVDGDFPREVLAKNNLQFDQYSMPAARNSKELYDAVRKGPAPKMEGVLRVGAVAPSPPSRPNSGFVGGAFGSAACVGISLVFFTSFRRRRRFLSVAGWCAVVATTPAWAQTIAFDELLAALGNTETADRARASIIASAKMSNTHRNDWVERLSRTATDAQKDIVRRGWAIATLGEIGGYDVDEALLSIQANQHQSMLVRTWAAAARVSMTSTVEGLIEKAAWIEEFPALGRPISVRLVEKMQSDGMQTSTQEILQAAIRVPQLQASLAPMLLQRGAKELMAVVVSADDQEVRRVATAYLGSLAVQGDTSVARVVTNAYRFTPQAEQVPWDGGPLYIPAIQWDKENARALVSNLIAWHLWCDRNNKPAEQQQIHNNLRSLSLAAAADYQSPGFQDVDTVQWLTIWGQAVGKQELRQLLAQQGADDIPKYRDVIDRL